MPTTTVYSSADDGKVASNNATYTTARSGSGLAATTNGGAYEVGQYSIASLFYACFEAWQEFNTSAIPDTATVTKCELNENITADSSTNDFTIEVSSDDFGAAVDTTDWIAGASLPSSGLLATRSTASIGTGYKVITESGTNFRSAINLTGDTRILLASSRHRIGNAPSTGSPPASSVNEYVQIAAQEATGTSTDPFLAVTWEPADALVGRTIIF